MFVWTLDSPGSSLHERRKHLVLDRQPENASPADFEHLLLIVSLALKFDIFFYTSNERLLETQVGDWWELRPLVLVVVGHKDVEAYVMTLVRPRRCVLRANDENGVGWLRERLRNIGLFTTAPQPTR